ncbi:WYL domain-containing protein [Paenibacillus rigui]|uniref:WYL domain-containing protein n=1 Tax=Paenibacillus rigui TaxID=554312 RepID=A0A229UJN0_9BACL|nr:WYL domain-containing protein [Paenibacillus rigui]OXM83514.1 WYL domain-containing protein [Paenibacillus rigui]
MSLFEKIFNYQVLSRLEDSGTCTVTHHERSWLKTMLNHPSAADAFTAATMDKLRALLHEDSPLALSVGFTEKARSEERQVYHPHLRPLRKQIAAQNAILMSYRIKGGRLVSDQPGFPYKLEYSMVKREWYLLWYNLRNRSLMSTRLQHIAGIQPHPLPQAEADRLLAVIEELIDNQKTSAVIEVVREYNRELSRILYAFSCFEKEVEYDAVNDTYAVRLTFLQNESEYVLSKARFLGKRIRIKESGYLRSRMYESATKALQRYGGPRL